VEVELTPDMVKPELVNRVNPTYPHAAQARRIEGTVILSILVSESGDVADVKVLRPAGGTSGLNEAATSAVRKWKFRPGVKDGKRVRVWVTYPIVFKLQAR
jgi:protein TonB